MIRIFIFPVAQRFVEKSTSEDVFFQPTASSQRRYFGIGKVTGASRQAMSDVQYPTSFWQMIRNLKNTETGVLVLNGGMLISLVGMSSSDMMVLRSAVLLGDYVAYITTSVESHHCVQQ